MKDKLLYLLAFLFLILGTWSYYYRNQWTGFYYTNPDLSTYTTEKGFYTLVACKKWATKKGSNQYECGQACKYNKEADIYSCKTTSD